MITQGVAIEHPLAERLPVVILASSRPDGNTKALVDMCWPRGDRVLEVLASLNVGCYSYEQANQDDDFMPLIRRCVAHHTWILATPLYWYSMSAQAKTFVDRLSDLVTVHKDVGRSLAGKGLGALVTGTDKRLPRAFDEPLQLTCDYLGMRFLGSHYAQFDDRGPVAATARHEALAFVQRLGASTI